MELEIVQKIKQIPNAEIRDKLLGYLEDKKVRGEYSKEDIDFFYTSGYPSFSRAVLWAIGVPNLTLEGSDYWINVRKKINIDPTCSFLNEVAKEAIEQPTQEKSSSNFGKQLIDDYLCALVTGLVGRWSLSEIENKIPDLVRIASKLKAERDNFLTK